LLDLGLEPHFLSETLIDGLLDVVRSHASRVDTNLIYPQHTWREGLLEESTPGVAKG
jgi:UDP-sulfoquinovose synthase